jgi:hypothetical protein
MIFTAHSMLRCANYNLTDLFKKDKNINLTKPDFSPLAKTDLFWSFSLFT